MSRSTFDRKKPAATKSATDGPVRSHSPSRSVPGVVHDVLRSPGESLELPVRSQMETRFGRDFSQVRVHTDEGAAEASKSVRANAFTAGRQIVFDSGQYQPETEAGQALIAHELTHVLQQGGSTELPTRLGTPGDLAEQEAQRASQIITLGGKMDVTPASMAPIVQREDGEKKKLKLRFTPEELGKIFPPAAVDLKDRKPAEEKPSGGDEKAADPIQEDAKERAEKSEQALEHIDQSLSGEKPSAGPTGGDVARKVGQKAINKALESILPPGVGVEIDLKGGATGTLDILKIINALRKRKKKKREAERAPGK